MSPRKLSLPLGTAPLPAPRTRTRVDAPPLRPLPPAQEDCARLWLCLHLPRLPLEVIGGSPGAPRAILGEGRKSPVILLCDDQASSRGIRPGMPVNAARALLSGLELRPREPAAERTALDELAAWAMRFTPLVSPDPSGALLLEIAASARLFGGAGSLRDLAVTGIRERGHAVAGAIAPTARGALWLARAGEPDTAAAVAGRPTPVVAVTGLAMLPGVLGRLPLEVTGWPESARRSLRRMGVSRIGECMRLPRDGFARRLGASCMAELDEALGRRPELRPGRREDTRFSGELDLPAETHEMGLLVAGLRILLERLERHLRARQAGAQVLWMGLRHRARPLTLLRIGLLRPSADARHLEELAALHLGSTGLPAPVIALTLEADAVPAPPAPGTDLLGREPDSDARMAGLVERLRMRLGMQAVHGIRPGREHRPEYAWQVREPIGPQRDVAAPARSRRPVWMLEHPAPLGMRAGDPVLEGPLTLESGPERIETGWWDGRDVRRDYYVACSPQGRRVWVFNDRRSGSWYLHGLFG